MLVTKFSIDKSKRCTTAWLNLRTLLSMQFFTYKVLSENSGLTHAKDCDACSLWKDVPLHNLLTYMDVFVWKCSHSAFAESKTMEAFHPDMSTYVKSCTRTRPHSKNRAESYRGQSSRSVSRLGRLGHSTWSVVLRGQSSWSSWSVVVVSRSSWMVFIFYGGYAHVFTETYGWGKPRSMAVQMYGGWVEHV